MLSYFTKSIKALIHWWFMYYLPTIASSKQRKDLRSVSDELSQIKKVLDQNQKLVFPKKKNYKSLKQATQTYLDTNLYRQLGTTKTMYNNIQMLNKMLSREL